MSTTPEDGVELTLDPQQLLAPLLAYEERVATIARDSLASVDGFHVIVRLTLKHLFGVQLCPHCPDCNNGDNYTPCQDIFGCSSTCEGGIFGSIEASFTSIEAQKSGGALHAHSQLFVQCLHQHTPLAVVLKDIEQHPWLVQGYLQCTTHVCRQENVEPTLA